MIGVQAASLEIRNLFFTNVGRAIDCSYDGSFLITVRDCIVQGAYSGFSCLNNITGSGENIQLFNFSCGSTTIGIDWDNDQGGKLTVYSSSFDYGQTFVHNAHGKIDLINCHFETRYTPASGLSGMIQNDGATSRTELIRPIILWTGVGTAPFFAYSTPAEPYGVYIWDPKFYGSAWSFATQIDAGAGGVVLVRSVLGNIPSVASLAALRTYFGVSPQGGDQVYLQGYRTPGDGGQGLFTWVGGIDLGG